MQNIRKGRGQEGTLSSYVNVFLPILKPCEGLAEHPSSFVGVFGKQIQKRIRVAPNVGRKVQKVPLQPVETCQPKYGINL